ncbi:MutS-related protein [Actinomadura hibisca]|uniref:MutS-related protein n=1 Tax=Actinomadura hibisca TaxID=68565 RepID=UPI00082C4CBF|nr:hypothetical protein [Actinomadura hibisca]
MRPGLLFADVESARWNADADLAEDLRLDGLWTAMADGDDLLFALARAVTLTPLTDPADIAHRQQVLGDCLDNARTVRELYEMARQAVTAEEKIFRGPATGMLNRSLRVLELFCDRLRELRSFATRTARGFHSPGFLRLFETIRTEVDESYLRTVEDLLQELRFEHGVIVTARLGPGNKSIDLRMHEPPPKDRAPVTRRFRRSNLDYNVPPEHEDSWRAIAGFRSLALQEITEAVAESADHVRDFFRALRDELGFYVGCFNLAEALDRIGLPTCLPTPHPPADQALSARELYEPGLALSLGGPVVANDLNADGTGLVMVTGTNRGGKTTFLRSLGLAQLMMQCGMFVCARSYSASLADGVFTHFKRGEDRSMSSGKLDEELARMSGVVDRLRPGALVLCNESFASTNEREGADIAAEILRGLTGLGIRMVFVTHLYDLAHRMHADPPVRCLFLTTTPDAEGTPTFRLAPGTPSPTANAMDLYARVFGGPPPG